MMLALLLAAQAPAAPVPQWRVAALGQSAVVYVDETSVARAGEEVRFRLQQRQPGAPTDSGRAVHAVTANCATRHWRSVYSWTYRQNGETLRAEETLTTQVRPGTIYGGALAAVCEHVLGAAVPDIDQHAAAYFAAPATPR